MVTARIEGSTTVLTVHGMLTSTEGLKDVFVITRLNTLFDIYETEADAMAGSSSVEKNVT